MEKSYQEQSLFCELYGHAYVLAEDKETFICLECGSAQIYRDFEDVL